LFQDWCSRPEEWRLPEEDRKYVWYIRGTRFSFPLSLPWSLPDKNRGALLVSFRIPEGFAAGKCRESGKPETFLQKDQLLTNSETLLCRTSYGTNSGNTADAAAAKSTADCSAAGSEFPIGTVTRTIAPSDLRKRTLSKTV